MRKLGLIGFAGSGKTSVLNEAKQSGFKTLDTDEMLLACNVDVSSLIMAGNFEKMRQFEKNVVIRALNSLTDVIAFGGGFHQGHCVWEYVNTSSVEIIFLEKSFENCIQRTLDRPLLKKLGLDKYRDLYEKRQNKYRDACERVIKTDGKTISEVWSDIQEKWN